MKADLRTAVESKALRVVYQPIVAMSTMRIASCEALCRWDHPDLGPVSPSVFIPLAERFGLINALGNWLIEDACRQIRVWREQGLRMLYEEAKRGTSGSRVNFVHPKDAGGVLVELVEPAKGNAPH
jgi:EAL domain-containing protein (putative c-di-GMP-specific phosphodiesterase class I)